MTLKVIRQDSTRDRDINAGRIQYLYGVDAAMQMIDNKVRGQLGEYKYNQTVGVDYSGNVFGANPNYQLFESQVRANVSSFSFVVSIDSFEYNVDSETLELNYEMTVTTIYGTESTSGTV